MPVTRMPPQPMKAKVRTIKRIRPGVEVAGLTDVGCQRENNEDRYAYWEPVSDAQFRHKGRLAIIADGMGGAEGGQEASRIAVETVERVYASDSDASPRSLLLAGFEAAHRRILDYASAHPPLLGMGTTCIALALLDQIFYYAHVGDSRLCLVRNGNICRLTHDHSYVSRLVQQGIITAEDALLHPHRNILTAALGAGEEIFPECPEQPMALEKGDVLVLSTDGLWTMVSEGEIQEALATRELKEACRALVQKAKERGAPDNLTLQVVRVCP
jgi:serine/threonine protein phosphatase PrpC